MIQPVAAPTHKRGRATVEKNRISQPSTPANQPCTSGSIVAVANQQPKHVGRESQPGSQQHQAPARRQPSHRPFFMTCNNQQDLEADQQPSSNLQPKTTTAEGSQLATSPRELETSNNKTSKQQEPQAADQQSYLSHRPKKVPRRRQASQNKATRAEGIDSYSKHRARNKPTNRPQPSTQQARKHPAEWAATTCNPNQQSKNYHSHGPKKGSQERTGFPKQSNQS